MKVTHVPPKPQKIIFEHFKTNDNQTAAEILARYDPDLWTIILGESVLSTIKFSPRYFWPIHFVKFEQNFETLKSLSDAVRDLGFDFANAMSLASLNLEDSTLSRKFPNLTIWQDENLDVYVMAFGEMDSVKRAVIGLASDVVQVSDINTQWIACQNSFRPYTPNLIN